MQKYSFELKKEIDKLTLLEDHELVSFDVVSLLTNISAVLIISALKSKWKFKKNHINLSLQEFLDGIIFILYNTFFQFNCSYYQQDLGSSMGYCTRPFLPK